MLYPIYVLFAHLFLKVTLNSLGFFVDFVNIYLSIQIFRNEFLAIRNKNFNISLIILTFLGVVMRCISYGVITEVPTSLPTSVYSISIDPPFIAAAETI
ncbi:hypothetical protein HK096_001615, partial [Nowakowskiella sp. JEL0078]